MQLNTKSKILLSVATFAMSIAVTSCNVYRPEFSQGQRIEAADVEQLRQGMTKKQVADLLGTPLIADSFHQNRWDYAYYLIDTSREIAQQQNLRIEFENNAVVRISHNIPADEPMESPDSTEATPADGAVQQAEPVDTSQ